jgi:nucleoside-diphosphate-sugar epimerase
MAGTITVFGGTGFIGRHLVALLLRTGKTVRMAVRHPGRVKTPAEATNSPGVEHGDRQWPPVGAEAPCQRRARNEVRAASASG